MNQYMVIETFNPECLDQVYQRFHQKGRMLPAGIQYLNSWLEKDGDRCFMLIETDDPSLFSRWTRHWNDLMNFEFVEFGDKPPKESHTG